MNVNSDTFSLAFFFTILAREQCAKLNTQHKNIIYLTITSFMYNNHSKRMRSTDRSLPFKINFFFQIFNKFYYSITQFY